MNLSFDEFERIVTAYKSISKSDLKDEQRRAARLDVAGSATILPLLRESDPSGKPLRAKPCPVQLRDLSLRGVRIVRNVAMPAGSQFVLVLPDGRNKPVAILCSVVHCFESQGQYSIGAEFQLRIGADSRGIFCEEEAGRISASILD